MEERLKLTKEGIGDLVDSTLYKQIMECLRYLTASRPNIVYSVGVLSSFMETPRQSHLQAAKRVLRFVKGSLTAGILYKREGKVDLLGFSDSD